MVSKNTSGLTLDDASTHIRLDVVHNSLDLCHNPVLGLQDLIGFDIQEEEGVDITESVEEFRLRKMTSVSFSGFLSVMPACKRRMFRQLQKSLSRTTGRTT